MTLYRFETDIIDKWTVSMNCKVVKNSYATNMKALPWTQNLGKNFRRQVLENVLSAAVLALPSKAFTSRRLHFDDVSADRWTNGFVSFGQHRDVVKQYFLSETCWRFWPKVPPPLPRHRRTGPLFTSEQ